MRSLMVMMALAVTALAGCVNTDDAEPPPHDQVRLYRLSYPQSDHFVEGHEHGWLGVFTNYGLTEAIVAVDFIGGVNGSTVLFQEDGGNASEVTGNGLLPDRDHELVFHLDKGVRVLVGAHVQDYADPNRTFTVGWRMATYTPAGVPIRTVDYDWQVTRVEGGPAVVPDHHVRTVTVGMWIRAESFYTNIAELINDPEFPADPAWVTPEDATEPLPVYVYDQNRTEQPYGSRDACYFSTIPGYNELLKTQAEDSTGIRLLQPEEAYTNQRALEADHPLYGDALVFMNTVTLIEGPVEEEYEAPNPQGECFDAEESCQYTLDRNDVRDASCPRRGDVDSPG